jgi:leucyl-tRNA synthetase
MELLNAIGEHYQRHGVTMTLGETVRQFVLLLAPFAPHLAEELWNRLGGAYSVHQQPWPKWDPSTAEQEIITLVVQLDGKVRDRIQVPADIGEVEAQNRALRCEGIARHLGDRRAARIFYVPGRLVNIVTA